MVIAYDVNDWLNKQLLTLKNIFIDMIKYSNPPC